MHISPLPGVTGERLLRALKNTERELGNSRVTGDINVCLTAYLKWANQAVRDLSPLLRSDDLNRLATTPRHWTLQTVNPTMNGNLFDLLNLEISEQLLRFGMAINDIEYEVNRWAVCRETIAIADTNIYIHQDKEFHEVPWITTVGARMEGVHLVIPLLVVDELDRQKRTNGKTVSHTNKMPVRTRARMTLKRINDLFYNPSSTTMLTPAHDFIGPVTVSLLFDNVGHTRLADADSEFVDRARSLQDFVGRNVTVVTSDIPMTLRARAAGLKTATIPVDTSEPIIP
jgi:hypothetical protein